MKNKKNSILSYILFLCFSLSEWKMLNFFLFIFYFSTETETHTQKHSLPHSLIHQAQLTDRHHIDMLEYDSKGYYTIHNAVSLSTL